MILQYIIILFINSEVFKPNTVFSLTSFNDFNLINKRRHSKLFSSKINWSNVKITTTNSNDNIDVENDSLQLIALKDFSKPTIINVDDLQAKWIDLCIENSKPEDLNKFSLNKIIPMVCMEDKYVEVVNRTLDRIQNIDN